MHKYTQTHVEVKGIFQLSHFPFQCIYKPAIVWLPSAVHYLVKKKHIYGNDYMNIEYHDKLRNY